MICARLGLTRRDVSFMRAKSCAVTMPCVSAFSGRCKLSTSAVAKNSSRLGATSKPASRARAIEPSRPQHRTCISNACPTHAKAADAAKSIDAECLAHHPGSQRAEPQAGLEPLHLLRNMAQGSKDQPPGEFGGGVGRTRSTCRDHDAVLGAGRQINVADVASGLADQLKPRQLFNDGPWYGRTLLDQQGCFSIA